MVKKVILSIVMICVIFVGGTCDVYASNENMQIDNNSTVICSDNLSGNFWERYRGTTAQNFITDAELSNVENDIMPYTTKSIVDILIEKNDIVLEETGRVCFVDAIGKFADGTYENIANVAEWKCSNAEVVSVYAGQLIAGVEGTATVTVIYEGIEKEITVHVEETIDVEKRIEEILRMDSELSAMSMTNAQRSSAVSIASDMVNMTWTPSQALVGWKGTTTFASGVTVKGIPYSQTPYQKDKAGFINSMSSSDFYTTYYNGNTSMPRYGNDCSGFLSFAWQINRTTTQGFLKGIDNGTYSTVGNVNYRIAQDANGVYRIYDYASTFMYDAFGYLAAGDALIQYGHTFMVAANSPTSEVVYVYEQTPSVARYTSHTYEDLVNGHYIPFTK